MTYTNCALGSTRKYPYSPTEGIGISWGGGGGGGHPTPKIIFFGGEGGLEKGQFVDPKNIHPPPLEGIFPNPPPPLHPSGNSN